MAKASLIARLVCAEGKTTEFEAALGELIDAANHEVGLEIYSAHRGEGNEYWFFELYTDQAAVEAHGSNEIMRAAMTASGAFLVGPPEVHHLQPVVAKGLDL